MGKTLFVTRMAEKLQAVVPAAHSPLITIPVHGPVVTTDSIVQSLVGHENTSECTIIHFDISPSVRAPYSYHSIVTIQFSYYTGVVASGHYFVLTPHPARFV